MKSYLSPDDLKYHSNKVPGYVDPVMRTQAMLSLLIMAGKSDQDYQLSSAIDVRFIGRLPGSDKSIMTRHGSELCAHIM